jgi:hypothetical protein
MDQPLADTPRPYGPSSPNVAGVTGDSTHHRLAAPLRDVALRRRAHPGDTR